MAIKLSRVTKETGVTLTEAYARIGSFYGSKDIISYQVYLYADGKAARQNLRPVAVEEYSFPTSELSGGIIASIYAHLKTQDGYTDGVDV